MKWPEPAISATADTANATVPVRKLASRVSVGYSDAVIAPPLHQSPTAKMLANTPQRASAPSSVPEVMAPIQPKSIPTASVAIWVPSVR